MSCSKEEINKLQRVFASEKNDLSRCTDHLLISFTTTHTWPKLDFKPHSNKIKIQKKAKFSTRYENSTFKYQAKLKNYLRRRNLKPLFALKPTNM
jgi:hypothetical protein